MVSLSHLFPLLTSRALLAMVGVFGLGEILFSLHHEFSCVPLYLSMCPMYGNSHRVRGGSILINSLDLHQLCEDLSFVGPTPKYLGSRLKD